MAFNKNCKYLGKLMMETDVIEKKTMNGKERVFRKKRMCLSDENKLEWVYECPKDCEYFKQK